MLKMSGRGLSAKNLSLTTMLGGVTLLLSMFDVVELRPQLGFQLEQSNVWQHLLIKPFFARKRREDYTDYNDYDTFTHIFDVDTSSNDETRRSIGDDYLYYIPRSYGSELYAGYDIVPIGLSILRARVDSRQIQVETSNIQENDTDNVDGVAVTTTTVAAAATTATAATTSAAATTTAAPTTTKSTSAATTTTMTTTIDANKTKEQ